MSGYHQDHLKEEKDSERFDDRSIIYRRCKICKRKVPRYKTIYTCNIGIQPEQIKPEMNPKYLDNTPWWEESRYPGLQELESWEEEPPNERYGIIGRSRVYLSR